MKCALAPLALLCLVCCASGKAQTAHYLDCSTGSDTGDSLTQQTAWRTVAQASAYVFHPGDSLLLRRGSHCEGMLWPKGSGTAQAAIRLSAYGAGGLPVIEGGKQVAGVQLLNQQYWEIENLEIIGGSPYGIHIGASGAVIRHFRITNVVVHDVTGEPFTKDSGLIVIAPDDRSGTRIDDVIIDGVTAYGTSQWAGIIVNGVSFDITDNRVRGEHIEVRNSIVHDVAGDGILLARVANGVLEHNVAWNTGMQDMETIGTPNAIWEWMCSDCHVAYNEGYFSDSPGVDGGIFDVDYGNENNLLENNFGHDSQGYCVSVFGAEGISGYSINSIVRNNTCIHNGRSPRLAKRQGAIFLYTWKGGKLNGVDIRDNTIIWDPPLDAPALHAAAEFTGNLANVFTGNTIMATSGSFVSSRSGLRLARNRFCRPQTGGGSDEYCGCMADILRATTDADMSGQMYAKPSNSSNTETKHRRTATHEPYWRLLSLLAPEGDESASASRGELTLIKSMMHQFASLGLNSVVVPTRSINENELAQWRADWNIDSSIHIDIANAAKLRRSYNLSAPQQLILISPSGQVAARWQYPVAPADVWLQLQSHLGNPAGMQAMPLCKTSAIQ